MLERQLSDAFTAKAVGQSIGEPGLLDGATATIAFTQC